MLQYEYNSVFFVCQKPKEIRENSELTSQSNGSKFNGVQEPENWDDFEIVVIYYV